MVGHLFLIGFMGSGKSSVGRLLAADLDVPFIDLDESIVTRAGLPIAEIFESQGEVAFRQLETDALIALQDSTPSVVACGGGVVLTAANRAALKRMGMVLYLKVDAAEALARIGDTSTRPLLAGPAGSMAATSLLAARECLYDALADATIDTRGLSISDVAQTALKVLSDRTTP